MKVKLKYTWQLILCNAAIQLLTTTLFLRLEVSSTEEGLEWLFHFPFIAPVLASTLFVALLRMLELGKAMANIILKWNGNKADFHLWMNPKRARVYVALDLILIFLAVVRVVVLFRTHEATTGLMYSIVTNVLSAFLGLIVYVFLEPASAAIYQVFVKKTSVSKTD
jgi:hypothetical protein